MTSDTGARLSPRFWVAVVATGIATGLAGIAMMVVLSIAEHLAFGYHDDGIVATLTRVGGSLDFQVAVGASSGTRRVVVLGLAGLFGGLAWYLLRRWTTGRSEVDEAIWDGDGRLAVKRSLGTSVISEIVIGMGASIGREAAPKLLGGVSGSVFADQLGLSTAQRKLLVACGAGAGLAAVYNVPLGGALFTAEILLGSLALPVVLPALVCAFIATLVGWLYLPDVATYSDVPSFAFSATISVWSLLAGVVIGVASAGYVRLVGWVSHHRAQGLLGLGAPLVAIGALGAISLAYPQLLGNGKDMAQQVFLGNGTLGLLLALAVLKPLVTAACLGSGASGGLFTPTMSTGAVLGGGLGLAWSQLWPGSPVGAFAMIGAAAMIGASMQAPLAALVLVLELTHNGFELMVPMIAATAVATVVVRYIDGYSIYSARLPSRAGALS